MKAAFNVEEEGYEEDDGEDDQNNLLQDFINYIKVSHVRVEVFTAVTMKNGVFWDVMPCGSCKNRRFGGT
jgi:hypothetical protein